MTPNPKSSKPDLGDCQVCDRGTPAVGVASVPGVPMSLAYCQVCIHEGIWGPLWLAESNAQMIGCRTGADIPEMAAEWFRESRVLKDGEVMTIEQALADWEIDREMPDGPRPPERIDPLLADLRTYWHANPDLRLGQIVCNLGREMGFQSDPFFAEDDGMHRVLRERVGDHPGGPPDYELIAKAFHEAYEKLAPDHNYETRNESAVPWEQVPENNRALMAATVRAMLASGAIKAP